MRKAGQEKSGSLSKEVKSLIEHDPYIRNTLADGLINYSALARILSSKIKQRLNRDVKEESLIVAIKRYADEINGKTAKHDYLDIISRGILSMQDHIAYALFPRNDSVLKELETLLNEGDWHSGEIRIIIDSPGRVIAMLKTPRMNSLIERIGGDVIDYAEGYTLLTMRQPVESRTTYGVISEIACALAKKKISIELISVPPDMHFLIEEKHAEEAYTTLRDLIKTAKHAMQERHL